MEKDNCGYNKHKTFDELMDFYKEVAPDYDQVNKNISVNLTCENARRLRSKLPANVFLNLFETNCRHCTLSEFRCLSILS